MHHLPMDRVNRAYLAARDGRVNIPARLLLGMLQRLSLSEFATDHDVVMIERIEHQLTLEQSQNVRYIENYRRGRKQNTRH